MPRPRSIARCSLLWLLVAPAAIAQVPARPRSVSTSRQFVVYGSDVRLRGAIGELAEQAKKTLLAATGDADNWRTPIVVSVEPQQANLPDVPPARLTVSHTGAGVKLQLDLAVNSAADAVTAQRELLRAILIERMYRDQPELAAGASYAEPPEWLIEGVIARNAGRRRETAELLSAVVRTNSILPLPQFLQQRSALLDPTSRTLHEAYSAALVELIVRTPDGQQRLRDFIRDLPRASADSLAEFNAHFAAFVGGGASVEAAWAEGVKSFARGEQYRVLGVAETEQALAAATVVVIPIDPTSAKTLRLEQFPEVLRMNGARAALRQTSDELSLLGARANPIYRGIVQQYREIAASLAGGHTRRIAQRLARLAQSRAELRSRMGQIDDFMNWFEATQSRTNSGLFTDYMNSAAGKNEPPHRRDAISRYLDTIESQLGD